MDVDWEVVDWLLLVLELVEEREVEVDELVLLKDVDVLCDVLEVL